MFQALSDAVAIFGQNENSSNLRADFDKRQSSPADFSDPVRVVLMAEDDHAVHALAAQISGTKTESAAVYLGHEGLPKHERVSLGADCCQADLQKQVLTIESAPVPESVGYVTTPMMFVRPVLSAAARRFRR